MTKVPKAKTVLDTERDAVNEQGEAIEFLDYITQKDESKAASLIMERGKEAEKATKEDKILKIEELEKSRKFKRKEYVIKLASLANDMMRHVDFPLGYSHFVGYGEDRLKIIITTKDGKKFGRGIIPTGTPEYDLNAVGVLLTQCENTIDMIMERGAFRKDGLILPK